MTYTNSFVFMKEKGALVNQANSLYKHSFWKIPNESFLTRKKGGPKTKSGTLRNPFNNVPEMDTRSINSKDGGHDASITHSISTGIYFLLLGAIIMFIQTLKFIKRCLAHLTGRMSYNGGLGNTIKRNGFQPLFIIVATFTLLGGVGGLEISSLVVPSYHVTGEPVFLECHVNLQGDTLYSVQWYKNSKEFFKYAPSEKNAMRVYDAPGVMVDRSLSTINKVRLRTVTMESSGKYKCEVSADAPSFHTTAKVAEMLVVDLPDEPPRLTGGRTKYHVGDEVYVNCTSTKSHPPASLMWYINEKQAKRSQLIEHAPIYDEEHLATSQLGVKFTAGLKHFPNGVLKLKCSSTIAAVYYQVSETNVEGHPSQSGPALESKGVYTDCSLSTLPSQLMWNILLLIIIINCG